MIVGGDSIDDTDVLRSGASQAVLGHVVMAPSTIGTFSVGMIWETFDNMNRSTVKHSDGPGPLVPHQTQPWR